MKNKGVITESLRKTPHVPMCFHFDIIGIYRRERKKCIGYNESGLQERNVTNTTLGGALLIGSPFEL